MDGVIVRRRGTRGRMSVLAVGVKPQIIVKPGRNSLELEIPVDNQPGQRILVELSATQVDALKEMNRYAKGEAQV